MVDKVKQGKKNRAAGAAFELRVRKDLEETGWIVDKWTNNVEFNYNPISTTPNLVITKSGKIIPAKRKWAGPGRPMVIGTGFPDFITFRKVGGLAYGGYEIVGVEVKTNGYLDKEEREKCRWYLDNKIFSKILIAEKTKEKNRIVIKYHDFEEKYKSKGL